MSKKMKEELVGPTEETRNWKGIIISILVIFLILFLIVIAVFLRQPPSIPPDGLTRFTFSEISEKHFDPKRFNGYWLNKEQFVYQLESGEIVIFDCTTQTQNVLLTSNELKQLFGIKSKFWMTNNTNTILFAYDIKHLFRHSYVARYKIYNTKTKIVTEVLPSNVSDTDQIQNAVLSPNAQRLVFVYGNNIYLMDKYNDGNKVSMQVTKDGEDMKIYNGITNWLYEEEILYQINAIWWSTDSTKIAYIKFIDTDVDLYSFPIYDGTPYNYMYRLRYPKPGTTNPKAKIFIFDVVKNETRELFAPQNLKEFYVWTVKWKDANNVIVVYVNRRQNSATTCVYNALSGKISMIKNYPHSTEGWNTPIGLAVSSKHNLYFQIWPYEGYKAVISFQIQSSTSQTITDHKFDVTEIVSFDEDSGYLYYIATNNDPRERQLFRKNIFGHHYISECITCEMELEETGLCKYTSVIFSPNNNYYILECLGDQVPMTYVKSIKNKTYEYVLERNDEIRNLMASEILPVREYMNITLDNNTNTTVFAEIMYPPKFDRVPIDNQAPVLLYVYNGPTTQIVDFQFRIRKFEAFLCTNLRIVVAVMDGRGADAHGDKFMKSVYKRLGELETADQQTLARKLKNELYTENSKFAIWGWSYGGFISAMSLFDADSQFNCSISGAPVVDWSLYDSAYSERYLGLYNENRYAYDISSNLMHLAKKNEKFYDKKKLLLIHGTGDDNVHFQNSAVLAKYLRTTGLDFEFEVYPDVQHTPDEETQRHLYKRMTKFLLNCYGMNENKYSWLFDPANDNIVEPEL